ncbi:MAG: hypothetical protein ACLFO3_05305 [Candidatus Acetothermia bacterium]
MDIELKDFEEGTRTAAEAIGWKVTQIAKTMTDRIWGLFILFSITLLIVGWGSFTHFDIPNKLTSGRITVGAEESRCTSCNLKKANLPTSELSEWKTFRSEECGFEFRYPPAGQVNTYSGKEGKKVRVDLPVAGETLLQEKFFLVKAENASDGEPLSNSEEEANKEVFINGREFRKKEFEKGAAGHIYEHTQYTTLKGDRLFVLDFVLHSVNPGVFESPPPGFDCRERVVFRNIASTFRFLD